MKIKGSSWKWNQQLSQILAVCRQEKHFIHDQCSSLSHMPNPIWQFQITKDMQNALGKIGEHRIALENTEYYMLCNLLHGETTERGIRRPSFWGRWTVEAFVRKGQDNQLSSFYDNVIKKLSIRW